MVRQTSGKLLSELQLFDVYYDEQRDVTSYAISMKMQDPEKTLSENAIDKAVQRVCDQLNQRLGVTLK